MIRTKLNSEIALKLKEDYLNGCNVQELSKSYKISNNTIRIVLEAYDIELKADDYCIKTGPDPEKLAIRNMNLKNDYENGMSVDDIKFKYGISESYIYSLVSKMGANRNKYRDELIRKIESDYITGMPLSEIAEKYNMSKTNISVIMMRNGITRPNYRMTKTDKELIEIIDKFKDTNVDIYALMTDRERNVVNQRLRQHLTYEEIASKYDVTKERIRQILNRALRQAKKSIVAHQAEVVRKENEKKLLELKEKQQQAKQVYENTQKEILSKDIDVIWIEDMDFSVRAYNCLKRRGINSLGELILYSEDDIRKIKYLGLKTLEEIKAKLEEFGLHLK